MAKAKKGGPDALAVQDLLRFCRFFERLASGIGLKATGELTSGERDSASDLVARMEAQLGYRLMSGGSGANAQPTAEGRSFYNAVVGPVHNLRAALETPGGAVRVRASEFGLHFFLPQTVGGFFREPSHAGSGLRLESGNWAEVVESVRTGKVDLGLAQFPVNAGEVESVHLLRVQRMLLYKDGHRFRSGKPAHQVGAADLARETVLIVEGDTIPYFDMRSRLPRPEKPGRHVMVPSTAHMHSWVAQGLGVAFGYQKFSADWGGGLKTTPLDVLQGEQYGNIVLYRRRDWQKTLSYHSRAFMGYLENTCAEYGEDFRPPASP